MKLMFYTLIIFPYLIVGQSAFSKQLELKYKGKTIHPKCFEKFHSPERITTLRVARNIEALGDFYIPQPEYKAESLDKCMQSKATFSVKDDGTVTYKDPDDPRGLAMLSYQALLEIKPNLYLIYTLENDGGSGYFSSVFIFKQSKSQLELVGHAREFGGDRCNGGTSIEEIKDNSILVAKKLTPVGLVYDAITDKKIQKKVVSILNDSAMSCIANKKTYITVKDGKIISENRGVQDINFESVDDESSKYQKCFNKRLKEYISKNNNKALKDKNIAEFVSVFKNKCMK